VAANVSLVIHRQRAEFGSVSVFCFAQSLNNGASHNDDFIFQPRVHNTSALLMAVQLAFLQFIWHIFAVYDMFVLCNSDGMMLT